MKLLNQQFMLYETESNKLLRQLPKDLINSKQIKIAKCQKWSNFKWFSLQRLSNITVLFQVLMVKEKAKILNQNF